MSKEETHSETEITLRALGGAIVAWPVQTKRKNGGTYRAVGAGRHVARCCCAGKGHNSNIMRRSFASFVRWGGEYGKQGEEHERERARGRRRDMKKSYILACHHAGLGESGLVTRK